MIEAGGLIRLHYHKNLDLLELFSETNQVLYYRDKSLFWNLELSQLPHNRLVKQNDGLFVDGTFTDRFSYHDNELYFDHVIISHEYTDNEIIGLIDSLWTPNPYEQLGKIDLSYWFELITANTKTLAYKNNSDSTMYLLITNPNNQSLKIEIDGNLSYSSDTEINMTLLTGQQIIVRENDFNELQNVVVTLK